MTQRLLFTVFALLAFAGSALAVDVTVTSFQIPNYTYGGSTAKIRLYSSDSFTDSNGVPHVAGMAGSTTGFYQEISVTVSGTTLTIPSFVTPSTTDSLDRPQVRITAVLFDYRGQRRETLFQNWIIPPVPASTTWAALVIVNNAKPKPFGDTYSTTAQVSALILAATEGFLDEIPSGAINGANATFTLTRTPVLGSDIELFINSQLQTRVSSCTSGPLTYTLSGSVVTACLPPFTGDVVEAHYRTSAGLVNGVVLTGSAGGDLTGSYPNPSLVPTGVTAGTYTSPSLVVDSKGRITSASSGIGVSGTVLATPDTLALRDGNGGTSFSGITVTSPVDPNLFNAERFTGHVNIGSANSTSADYKLNVIHSSTATSNASQSGYGIIARMDMQTPSGTSSINAKGVYGTVWTTGAATYSGQISALAGNGYMLAGSGPVGSTTTGPGDNQYMAGVYGRVRNESASDMWLGYGIVSDGPYAVGAGHIKKYAGLKIVGPYTGQVDLNYGIIQSGGGYNQLSGAVSIGFDPSLGTPADPMAALDVKGGVGGSTDMLRLRYPTGETVIRVNFGGGLALGATNSAPVIGTLTVFSTGVGTITAVLKAISSQSADLLQIRNSSDATVLSVGPTGTLSLWDGSALKTVSVYSNDSCGSGFRCLRIPN